jgi:hypothetical protein
LAIQRGSRITYNLVELFVLLIGIVGEVVIQVVLSDGIYNVVCHITISNFIFVINYMKKTLLSSL